MSRLKNVAIAADQLVNTIFGGKPDETLSAKAYRCKDKKAIWKFLYNLFNFLLLDSNHCYQSYLSEVERKQLPREYSD